MAFGWDTALNVLNDTAVQCGLAAVADPYASTDPNFVLLRGLLKSLGQNLRREKELGWTWLQKEASFVTTANVASYALPADFGRMIPQTGWNRTNRLPLGGPLSPEEWQYLKARLVGVVFTVLFRPQQQKLFLYPDTNTPGGYTIAYEYSSRYWVQPTGQSSATAEAPSASTDTLWYDSQLLIAGLKLAWKKERGFDTTAAQGDYDALLNQIKADDGSAPVLSLGRVAQGDLLIGSQSIPYTGFGK